MGRLGAGWGGRQEVSGQERTGPVLPRQQGGAGPQGCRREHFGGLLGGLEERDHSDGPGQRVLIFAQARAPLPFTGKQGPCPGKGTRRFPDTPVRVRGLLVAGQGSCSGRSPRGRCHRPHPRLSRGLSRQGHSRLQRREKSSLKPDIWKLVDFWRRVLLPFLFLFWSPGQDSHRHRLLPNLRMPPGLEVHRPAVPGRDMFGDKG